MSTALVPRWRAPYLIVQGSDNALTLPVYSAAGVQQTATVGTVTIKRGLTPTEVVTDAAATALGPPVSYTLLAAATSALTLDPIERWDVQWTLTIGGVAYKFRRPGWLTEFDLWPQIIDTDLESEAAEVQRFRTAGGALTSFQVQRSDAWEYLIRDLYARGVQVHLVTDGGALVQAHLFRTLGTLYGTAASSLQDERYERKATEYMGRYHDEIAKPLPMDRDADGAIDQQDERAEDLHPWDFRPRAW